MNISDFNEDTLRGQLENSGIILQAGPFKTHITSTVPSIASNLVRIYKDFPVADSGFSDFHIEIKSPRSLRQFIRPQAIFYFDGKIPFKPLPYQQSFPMFEWGLNWCISSNSHQYMIIHAAVVAKDDRALIMPAPPGSGKSTLCAALVNRGWRLLSDELTLVRCSDSAIQPLSRPVNLKNDSIDVIKDFEPTAVFTEKFHDTSKGTVALMRPPEASVREVENCAKVAWVITPKYEAGSETILTAKSRANMYMMVAKNSFNYSTLGSTGFKTLSRMMNDCGCYDLVYSNLDEAISTIDDL